MKTKIKLPVKLFAAFAAVIMLFASSAFAQKNKKGNEDKIHLKIITNENGNVIEIDTVFDAKDKEAAQDFMKKHNMKMEMNGDADKQIHIYKSEESDTNAEVENTENNKVRAQVEMELEQLRSKMDTLNGKSFSFDFKLPDENELKALEEKMKDMKFDFKFDGSELPELPEMHWNTEGMSPEEKAKFEEHMQKAREEMQKALEMMKDSGNFKMHFYFNDDSDMEDGSYNEEKEIDNDVAVIHGKNPAKTCTVKCTVDGDSKSKSCAKIVVISDDNASMSADKSGEPKVEKRFIVIEKSKSKIDKDKFSQQKKSENQESNRAEKSNENAEPFSDLNVFPNPTGSTFDVSFKTTGTETLLVKIMDTTGKEVISESYENFSGVFNKQYNMSEYGKGVYLLMLKQGANWTHKKVVVK